MNIGSIQIVPKSMWKALRQTRNGRLKQATALEMMKL